MLQQLVRLALLLLCSVHCAAASGLRSRTSAAGRAKRLKLFDREASIALQDAEAVTTVTWFDCDSAAGPPVQHLRQRIDEIIALNPWLAGRLVRPSFAPVFVEYSDYKTSSGAAAPLFQVLRPADVIEHQQRLRWFRPRSPHVLRPRSVFDAFTVLKPNQCVNRDEPLFRVTVVQPEAKRFAVCCSLSHALGDGSTFYALYHMLSGDCTPRALIAERNEPFHNKMMQFIASDEEIIYSPSLITNILVSSALSREYRLFVRSIDMDWVEQQKQNYAQSDSSTPFKEDGKAPFVSTNDIITSLFLRCADCDLGGMAVNFRDRIPGLTVDFAGNYEGGLLYQRGDYESPQLIRSSLVDGRFRRASASHHPLLLSDWRDRITARLALVTNWSTFYQRLVLEGCRETLHVPHFLRGRAKAHAAVIFQANETTTALMTVEPEPADMQKILAAGAVGAEITIPAVGI